MEEALIRLYTHFGVQMPPPPIPRYLPEPNHTYTGNEAMMTAIIDMVVQTMKALPRIK